MSQSLSQPQTANLTPGELAAWRGLLRAHAALVKVLDGELEAAHDLPLSSYEVLLTLEQQQLRMCDLAESVLLSRSGLTRLIDRLERDGLVERRSCEDDARGAYAVLTTAGRAKLGAARETHLAGVREHFLERLSGADLAVMASFWERLALTPAATEAGCG
ncbi:MAG: MarR family winged helix-turn-helix transcriptional regulator [Solirubrobacteraceae bacterium]